MVIRVHIALRRDGGSVTGGSIQAISGRLRVRDDAAKSVSLGQMLQRGQRHIGPMPDIGDIFIKRDAPCNQACCVVMRQCLDQTHLQPDSVASAAGPPLPACNPIGSG